MLRSVKDLRGYSLHAEDGELGSVDDLLFDGQFWHIRYFVIATRVFLPRGRVLISPASVARADGVTRQLFVNLTREQVRNSPDVDSDAPVSRQMERELATHYNWPIYWSPYDVPAPALLAQARSASLTQEEEPVEEVEGDPNLHSSHEVMNYHIKATDGEIGHVADFIVDDDVWVVRYVVVDTRKWLPGRRVLISPGWIRGVDWSNQLVDVHLDRQAIKESPEFDPTQPVNREYETRLYDFYGRPKYWEH